MAKEVELVQLPESMECPLCLATFKAPTLLRCGHTFCKVCLDEYDEKHRGQEFMECPLCNKRTKLGRSRVAGLAPNFSVKGIKEDLKGNGKSPVFCSLHSEVYKDILCEVCKEFICLTCLFDKHQGHSFKKKEELKAYLKKKRKSLIKRSEENKAQIKVSITSGEQDMRDMHYHLDKLDREIEHSFREKSEILRRHRERLSKEVDDIRTKSAKVVADCIEHQKHSLQRSTSESTFMRQEGVASTSAGTFTNSDALKTRYIDFLDLENELERELLSGIPVVKAKRVVKYTKFYAYDTNVLDLGTLNACVTKSERDQLGEFEDFAILSRRFGYISPLHPIYPT